MIANQVISRRGRPCCPITITVRNICVNKCAGRGKICRVGSIPTNDRAVIMSNVKIGAGGIPVRIATKGIGQVPSVRVSARTRRLRRMRIVKGSRTHQRRRRTCTVSMLSVGGTCGDTTPLGGLLGGISDIHVHRRNNVKSGCGFDLGKFSNGRIGFFLSKVPVSGFKSSFGLTGVSTGVTRHMRMCGKMLPMGLNTSTLKKTIGVIDHESTGCLSTACSFNSFGARGISIGKTCARLGANFAIHTGTFCGCSSGSCGIFIPVVSLTAGGGVSRQ